MPLSLLDMPAVRAAVSDLYRILEDPTPANETARRAFRWSTGRSTLGEQDPTGKTASVLVGAGVEWVMFHLGNHTRGQCPEITDSLLDLKTKAALLELRGELLPPFASHQLANDAGVRVRFLVFLEDVLARIAAPAAGGVTPAEADTAPAETQQGEGRTPGNNRPRGIPLAEAEIRVRDWLAANAKDKPAAITRDAVAAGSGVSAGQVSMTAVWKAFRDRRNAEAKPGAREIPLTDAMQAVVPDDCETPDELAELIEEQERERAEEERRRNRRHNPS